MIKIGGTMNSKQNPPCMWCQGQMMNPNINSMTSNENMTNPYSNMMVMEDKDLEMLYPKLYFNVIPIVKYHCDKIVMMYGTMYCPRKDEMEKILDDICEKLEKDIDKEEDEVSNKNKLINNSNNENDDENNKCKKHKKDKCREDFLEENSRRRRRYDSRRLLRDFVGVVLVNELIGRRRPYYNPYYGPYGY